MHFPDPCCFCVPLLLGVIREAERLFLTQLTRRCLSAADRIYINPEVTAVYLGVMESWANLPNPFLLVPHGARYRQQRVGVKEHGNARAFMRSRLVDDMLVQTRPSGVERARDRSCAFAHVQWLPSCAALSTSYSARDGRPWA